MFQLSHEVFCLLLNFFFFVEKTTNRPTRNWVLCYLNSNHERTTIGCVVMSRKTLPLVPFLLQDVVTHCTHTSRHIGLVVNETIKWLFPCSTSSKEKWRPSYRPKWKWMCWVGHETLRITELHVYCGRHHSTISASNASFPLSWNMGMYWKGRIFICTSRYDDFFVNSASHQRDGMNI
jgi:hypothetical protein